LFDRVAPRQTSQGLAREHPQRVGVRQPALAGEQLQQHHYAVVRANRFPHPGQTLLAAILQLRPPRASTTREPDANLLIGCGIFYSTIYILVVRTESVRRGAHAVADDIQSSPLDVGVVDDFSFGRSEQKFHAHRDGISGQLNLLAQLQLHPRNHSAHSQHVQSIPHSFTSEIRMKTSYIIIIQNIFNAFSLFGK
jgi:hypothetical protein